MASSSASQTSTPLTHPSTAPSSPAYPLKTTAILLWPCSAEGPEDTVVIHSSREEADLWVEDVHVSVSSDSKDSVVQFERVKPSKNCCCQIV